MATKNNPKWSSVSERLKELRLREGLTQVQFAEKFSLSQGTYQKYERGLLSIPLELIEQLRHFGVTADWLLFGIGDLPTKEPEVSAVYSCHSDECHSTIPLMSYVGAGAAYAMEIPHDDAKRLPKMPGMPDDCYALLVEGDSMEPVVHAGDYLIVQEVKTFEKVFAGLDYVVITENGPLVKTVYYTEEEGELKRFRLSSYNRVHPDIYPEQIYRVFRIKQHIKKYVVPEYLDKNRRQVAAELKDIPGIFKRIEK